MKLALSNKFALYAIMVSMICFSLSSVIFYFTCSRYIFDSISSANLSQISMISEKFDLLTKDLINDIDTLTGTPYTQEILNNYDMLAEEERKRLISNVDDALGDFILKRDKEVLHAEIISKKYESNLNLRTIFEYSNPDSFKDMHELLGDREFVWLDRGAAREKYYSSGQIKYLTFMKKIYDIESGEIIGIMKIFFNKDFFKVFTDTNLKYVIINNNRGIVYQSDGFDLEKYGNILTDDFSKANGFYNKQILNSKYLIVYTTSEYNNWKVVGCVSLADALQEMKQIRNYILLIGLLCLSSCVLFSFILSYRITKPINQMDIEISKISSGNIDDIHRITTPKTFFNGILGNKYYITAIYTLIIITPTVTAFLLISSMSYESIEKHSINSFMFRMQQLGDKLETKLRSYDKVAKYIFSEKQINEYLVESISGRTVNDAVIERKLDQIVERIPILNSGELGINIFDAGNDCIYFTNYKQTKFEEQLDVIKNNESNTNVFFPAVYDCGTYIINFGKKFVALDNWPDVRLFDTIGYLIFSLNEGFIENIYRSELKMIDGSNIYIIDAKGRIISHPDKTKITGIMEESYLKYIYGSKNNKGTFPFKKDSKQYILTYIKLDTSDWIMICEAPVRSIIEDIDKIKAMSVILLVFNIALVITLFLLFISHVLKQVTHLNNAISAVSKGDMDVRAQVKTGDEIQRLADGFNNMVSKLKWFMEDNYKKGIRAKEAELNALQAQINPHFLYNTLESINWKAMMLTKGQNTVSNMVTALATLLRLSISRGGEVVTFEDEINHVKSYLVIQKERYSNKFEVEWDIDPRIYSYKCLKLILQPIVENAIYHGLELKPDKGILIIRGELLSDIIKISIIDNGRGMSRERLETVRGYLERRENAKEQQSIGLTNVNERIKLYFGDEYGLKIFSEQNEGTVIEIHLPLIAGE
ncbi:MAG TPA: sensor histidine kinase [Clostridiaceae bacterium]|nr:sensor histidine kinase [Clostridiaceae bacterium]